VAATARGKFYSDSSSRIEASSERTLSASSRFSVLSRAGGKVKSQNLAAPLTATICFQVILFGGSAGTAWPFTARLDVDARHATRLGLDTEDAHLWRANQQLTSHMREGSDSTGALLSEGVGDPQIRRAAAIYRVRRAITHSRSFPNSHMWTLTNENRFVVVDGPYGRRRDSIYRPSHRNVGIRLRRRNSRSRPFLSSRPGSVVRETRHFSKVAPATIGASGPEAIHHPTSFDT
jgi:hypothetical protein